MRSRALAWLSLAFVAAVACDNDAKSHVYVAAQYDPVNDCLAASTTLDTIDTGDTSASSSLCAPTCLVSTDVSGTVLATYVSTMCGPYPASVDISGTDPSCALALTAYANGSSCDDLTGDDGGGGDDSATGDDDSSAGDDGGGDDGGGSDTGAE